jgi:hypothetical protein
MALTLLDLAVYTPILQFVIAYCFLYRYDLGRFRHPHREKTGRKVWLGVLSELDLVKPDSVGKEEREEGRRMGKLRVSLSVAALMAATLVAWAFATFVVPSAVTRFATPVTFLAQFLPASVLMAGVEKRLGPLPVKPYKYALPERRLGSRVRHVEGSEHAEGGASQ